MNEKHEESIGKEGNKKEKKQKEKNKMIVECIRVKDTQLLQCRLIQFVCRIRIRLHASLQVRNFRCLDSFGLIFLLFP